MVTFLIAVYFVLAYAWGNTCYQAMFFRTRDFILNMKEYDWYSVTRFYRSNKWETPCYNDEPMTKAEALGVVFVSCVGRALLSPILFPLCMWQALSTQVKLRVGKFYEETELDK